MTCLNASYKQTIKFLENNPETIDVYKIVKYKDNRLFSIWSKLTNDFEYKPGHNEADAKHPPLKDDCKVYKGIHVFYFTGKILEAFLDREYSDTYVIIKLQAHVDDLIAVGKYGDECVFSKVYLSNEEYDKAREKVNTPKNDV